MADARVLAPSIHLKQHRRRLAPGDIDLAIILVQIDPAGEKLARRAVDIRQLLAAIAQESVNVEALVQRENMDARECLVDHADQVVGRLAGPDGPDHGPRSTLNIGRPAHPPEHLVFALSIWDVTGDFLLCAVVRRERARADVGDPPFFGCAHHRPPRTVKDGGDFVATMYHISSARGIGGHHRVAQHLLPSLVDGVSPRVKAFGSQSPDVPRAFGDRHQR